MAVVGLLQVVVLSLEVDLPLVLPLLLVLAASAEHWEDLCIGTTTGAFLVSSLEPVQEAYTAFFESAQLASNLHYLASGFSLQILILDFAALASEVDEAAISLRLEFE